ncbi:MAG TPA: hypothetical protein VES73_18630, partial [Lamprocystis sp. (in: g-proteobacteria)]|nr:hypothetical protein [Lamprocystis sp. (in: g-proteobacteria)]
TRGADAGTIKFSITALVLSALMVVGLVTSGRLGQPLVLVPLAFGVALIGYWLWCLFNDGSPAAVQTLVGHLTLGLIALNALLLLGTGHWLAAPIVLLLLVPNFRPAQESLRKGLKAPRP